MIGRRSTGFRGLAEALPQLTPLTASQHGALLHGGSFEEGLGYVALATKIPGQVWHEKAYRVSDLPEVLPRYAGVANVYLSPQRFWGWRLLALLAECGAIVIDVDFHKVPVLAQAHPLGALEDCRIALERAGKPQPSLAVASGRGLCLSWFHEPVPRRTLPRWNACQRELWEVLRPLGADRRALGATQMFRLVGSIHSSTGLTVEALTAPREVWEFDVLADEVLPHTRAEIADLRIRRAARNATRPRRRPAAAIHALDVETLWEGRLTDLQTLRRLRWSGSLPPGQRDYWMLLAGTAMSYLAPPERLEPELNALAQEAAGWDDREARSRMQAIFKRARMAAKGESVVWEGLEMDPRYRYTNDTIIEIFEITPDEQKEMRVLISPAEKRRRRLQKARQAGVISRDGYRARASRRRAEARALYIEQGKSVEEIAQALGVSIHSVRSYVFR